MRINIKEPNKAAPPLPDIYIHFPTVYGVTVIKDVGRVNGASNYP